MKTARSSDPIIGRLAHSLRLLGDADPDKLLNVGCASGWLEREARTPWTVAVDVAPVEASETERVETLRASALDLPFQPSTFDAVTMFEVLEHLPKHTEMRALGEIRRVLSPGGTLLLSTPNRHPAGTALDPAWWIRGHRHYSRVQLDGLLRRAGFEIVTMDMRGALVEAVFLPLFYLFIRLGRPVPGERRWHEWLDREYSRPGWYTHFVIARSPR